MHKSLGSAVTGLDAINMTPPEVLNYLFLRSQPNRAIDYDYGMGLLDMADEYDRMERAYFSNEFTEAEENNVAAYVIAQHNHVPEQLPLQISYRHLVNVVQMTKDFDGVMQVLGRTEDMSKATDFDIKRLQVRVDCIRFWLANFAPENVKFSIQEAVPANIELSADEKAYFKALASQFKSIEWNADQCRCNGCGQGWDRQQRCIQGDVQDPHRKEHGSEARPVPREHGQAVHPRQARAGSSVILIVLSM